MTNPATDLETRTGDSYKSKGEKQVARFLDRYGYNYRYEYPMAVIDRGKTKIWYPDFLLPDYGIIIEYAGVTGNNGYAAQLERKKEVYSDLGMPVIFLKPESFQGYWPGRLQNSIENILKGRTENFYRQTRPCYRGNTNHRITQHSGSY